RALPVLPPPAGASQQGSLTMTAAPNNSMQLEGKTILLGITGGIAAYKSCNIVRLLQKRGARVKVVMSEHATEVVGPLTFRALTNEPVAVGLFDEPSDPIHHISLAQEPDLVVVAPATANIIAKMANGIADDLISTTLLATPRPIVIAPAMNNGMWKAPATQANMATLRDRGVHVVGPGSGYLACGDVDTGRMSEPEDIVEAICEVLNPVPQDLADKRIMITAGPTHEPIDRCVYRQRSSGKMGIALAGRLLAAVLRSRLCWADIARCSRGVEFVRVQTAAEMLQAALGAFQTADAAICAAAVADYTPAAPADHKLKKANERLDRIELVETVDILAELSRQKGERRVIGFAAETDNVVEYAQHKLARKGCDAIIANDVSRADSGFGTDTNKAWIVSSTGAQELPVLTKPQLADTILDLLQN
ncbi:MAG: bifunctional phosphopantothenoylcysteine decarboxylase/phosphopantothenate--cysteine ligase CoaBC, partial [Collinsella sp.]